MLLSNERSGDIERKVRDILNSTIGGPSVKVDGVTVPVYELHEECENKPEYYNSTEFQRAIKRYGAHSPNMVKAIIIGSDAVVKTYFTGEELRYSFGREGRRILTDTAYMVAARRLNSIKGLLSNMLDYKMYNIEEIYVDKAILTIGGMNLSQLDESNERALVANLLSEKFNQRLFGGDKILTEEFKRLKVISLGDRVLTVKQFKGYWELGEQLIDGSRELLNRHWVVEDKVYKADNDLYNFVTEYNRKYNIT